MLKNIKILLKIKKKYKFRCKFKKRRECFVIFLNAPQEKMYKHRTRNITMSILQRKKF